jgi:hypothetical protein
MSKAQLRRSEADVQESAAAGEMEGTGLRGAPGPWLHEMGQRVGGAGLGDEGLLQRPRHGFWGVESAPGHAVTHLMMGMQAALLPREVRRLRPR